jgi:hypothetical protein
MVGDRLIPHTLERSLKMKKTLTVVVAALLAVAIAASTQFAQDSKPVTGKSDFPGKILSLRVASDLATSYFLGDAKIISLGGKSFLVGMCPSGPSMELDTKTLVAMDHVVSFSELTPKQWEDYKKNVKDNMAEDQTPTPEVLEQLRPKSK